jgi:hypothetical protein
LSLPKKESKQQRVGCDQAVNQALQYEIAACKLLLLGMSKIMVLASIAAWVIFALKPF